MKHTDVRANAARNDWQKYPATIKRRSNSAKLRKTMLAEQPRCNCGPPATEVDHIISVCIGLTDDRANLVRICRPCHLSKSGREANVVRWVMRCSCRMDRGNG